MTEPTPLPPLAQEILELWVDLQTEQKINVKKSESVSLGEYPYGEGMGDGLRYAAEGLARILRRHGIIE